MSKTDQAIAWMEATARNDAHGYDQRYRWGEKGDYDCSSAVITAWQNAGVPVKTKGATYTGNMLPVFLRCGFQDVTGKVNRATGAGLQRGDVLLNTAHHTAMYCGNGLEVEASINEKGGAIGGVPGDQTGREFLIRSYRNYPWTNVLRYKEAATSTASTTITSNDVHGNRTVTGTGHCTGNDVNIRKGPGTNYANIHGWPKLNSGNQFEICDSKSGWYYILIAGKYYGWIYGQYVAIDSKKTTPTPSKPSTSSDKLQTAQHRDDSIAGKYKVIADALNLRAGAGTNYKVLDLLLNGTTATCYGYYNVVGNIRWYLVVANGKTGYVSSQYLKKY